MSTKNYQNWLMSVKDVETEAPSFLRHSVQHNWKKRLYVFMFPKIVQRN